MSSIEKYPSLRMVVSGKTVPNNSAAYPATPEDIQIICV